MVLSVKGLAAHLAFVRLLPGVYFHVLPPTAALHEPPATVPADKRPLAGVRAHVDLQALRCAQLLAAFRTLHAGVQADWFILGLRAVWFIAQMRALTPGRFETLPTVGAAEMTTPGNHRHLVPSLAVVFQILQVLEAACTGRAGVEPTGRSRGVGFAYMDPQKHFGLKAAAADSACVFRGEVESAA